MLGEKPASEVPETVCLRASFDAGRSLCFTRARPPSSRWPRRRNKRGAGRAPQTGALVVFRLSPFLEYQGSPDFPNQTQKLINEAGSAEIATFDSKK